MLSLLLLLLLQQSFDIIIDVAIAVVVVVDVIAVVAVATIIVSLSLLDISAIITILLKRASRLITRRTFCEKFPSLLTNKFKPRTKEQVNIRTL